MPDYNPKDISQTILFTSILHIFRHEDYRNMMSEQIIHVPEHQKKEHGLSQVDNSPELTSTNSLASKNIVYYI